MTEVCLIDWNVSGDVWTVAQYGKMGLYYSEVRDALAAVIGAGCLVAANENMPADRLAVLVTEAAYMGVNLLTRSGKPVLITPVPDAKVRYITKKELGNILPDGWFIEQQLDRFAACHGEDMTFAYRPSLARAILDIQAFLAASAAQAAGELVHSIAATLEQTSFDV